MVSMRTLKRLLFAILVAWGLLSAYVFLWFRDRYSSRGPMPYTMRWILHTPLRRLVHSVLPMLDRFGVRPGATVLELGPGNGYFSIEAARRLGSGGRLVCLDIQRPMLTDLRGRLTAAGVTNAHPVLGDAHHLPLADASVDVAFLVTVLGEIPDRPQGLAELRRVLKPGGTLSITESLTDPDYQFEDTVRDVCRASGFTPMDHQRNLLGFTMNFAAPPGR
jgi:ubiquinone/menaquinone biosynthesis C-methylase UbiE